MSTVDTVISMRQRDRLPLIALAVTDDLDRAINITGGTAEICFRMLDGPLFPSGFPWQGTDWYVRQVLIANGPGGVVSYDWSQVEADNVAVGIIDVSVRVVQVNGDVIYAPTDHRARIVMRPEILPRPGDVPGTYGADRYGTGIYADPTPIAG